MKLLFRLFLALFLSTLACCQRVNSSFAKYGGPASQTLSWESKGVCIGISTAASLSASQLRYEWRPFLQIHNPAGLLIWGYSFLQPYTSRFGLASVGVLAIYYAWAYEWAWKKVRCAFVFSCSWGGFKKPFINKKNLYIGRGSCFNILNRLMIWDLQSPHTYSKVSYR